MHSQTMCSVTDMSNHYGSSACDSYSTVVIYVRAGGYIRRESHVVAILSGLSMSKTDQSVWRVLTRAQTNRMSSRPLLQDLTDFVEEQHEGIIRPRIPISISTLRLVLGVPDLVDWQGLLGELDRGCDGRSIGVTVRRDLQDVIDEIIVWGGGGIHLLSARPILCSPTKGGSGRKKERKGREDRPGRGRRKERKGRSDIPVGWNPLSRCRSLHVASAHFPPPASDLHMIASGSRWSLLVSTMADRSPLSMLVKGAK